MRAVGLDVEHQAVEVGGLLHPDRLDGEGHPAHRREDGVDRDDADGGGPLVLVGREVAPAPLDGEVDGQPALAVERGDVLVGVEHLDVRGDLQVAGGGIARPPLVEADGHRLLAVHPEQDVLQVQDEVGDVLLDPGEGGELVEGVVEADLGDGGPGDRRQQGAPERVPEGVPEARVERPDGEPLAVVLLFADGFDGGSLDDEHADQGSSAVWCAVSVVVVRIGFGRVVQAVRRGRMVDPVTWSRARR